jgi:hypothetical protein
MTPAVSSEVVQVSPALHANAAPPKAHALFFKPATAYPDDWIAAATSAPDAIWHAVEARAECGRTKSIAATMIEPKAAPFQPEPKGTSLLTPDDNVPFSE